MKVNLHMHSNISDGLDSISELATKINDNPGIYALTDHDTIKGVSELRRLVSDKVTIINGCEITTSIDCYMKKAVIHLVALDYDEEIMIEKMQQYNTIMRKRMEALLEVMTKDGYIIEINDEIITKKKIAIALCKKKYAENMKDAFAVINQYPFYKMFFYSICDVIKFVHQAKGKVIWAHPYNIFVDGKVKVLNNAQVCSLVEKFSLLNLDGIESLYDLYEDEKRTFLSSLAQKYNLLESIATDYHNKENKKKLYLEVSEQRLRRIIK